MFSLCAETLRKGALGASEEGEEVEKVDAAEGRGTLNNPSKSTFNGRGICST
jgi:hypothetical protein